MANQSKILCTYFEKYLFACIHKSFCLFRYVYALWGKSKALTHDSYFCMKYPGSIGFPTQRKPGIGNFVGAAVGRGDYIDVMKKKNECPLKCRRNKNWKFC